MNLFLLLAAPAFAVEIERFPSYRKVDSVWLTGDWAVVLTADGAYQLGLEPGWPWSVLTGTAAASPGKAPETEFKGFPVTGEAEWGGVEYVGTFGGGLFERASGRSVAGA